MKTLSYLAATLIIAGSIASCSHPKIYLSAEDPNKIAIHNNGVKIAYTDTGKNDTTLLFVHGWAINRSYWADQKDFFGKQYRVVTIDLPGFGQSGKNRDKWDTETFASDVDSVIAALKLKKVVLIGHSMSGDIVLQSAIDNKDLVIGLVGVDNLQSAGRPVTAKDKKEFTEAIAQMKLHFKAVATDYFNQALFSKTTTAEVKKRVLNDANKVDSAIAIASLNDGSNFNEVEKLKASGQKLYLINSDRQLVDTTRLTAAKIPFKIYYIHDSGHYPMIEHTTQFNEFLRLVMADIAARK